MSRLPEKDTPEAQKIIERIKAGDRTLVRELGYPSWEFFLKAIRRSYDFYISKEPVVVKESKAEEPIIINLPPVRIREYKAPKKKKGDEEIAVLHFSCGHAGKITKSFDADVYRARMQTMFESVMTIITLHRNMYPISKLYIVNVGDNIQGENPFQGSKVGTINLGARDQTIQIAFPAWVELIASLKQEFVEVYFEGFGGNHGHDRLAPETSREDFRLYDLLNAYFQKTKGIEINIHEEFAEIINIGGFKFFCFHGDGIPCQQGVPFFALDKKLKSWYMQFGGFNYALGGHFHKRHSDEVSSRFEYLMAATLVSDDEWALKKLGISSSPSENIFGIHPRHGMTWRYPIVVDFDFLPERSICE